MPTCSALWPAAACCAQELVALVADANASTADKAAALAELQVLVEPIDNANGERAQGRRRCMHVCVRACFAQGACVQHSNSQGCIRVHPRTRQALTPSCRRNTPHVLLPLHRPQGPWWAAAAGGLPGGGPARRAPGGRCICAGHGGVQQRADDGRAAGGGARRAAAAAAGAAPTQRTSPRGRRCNALKSTGAAACCCC